MRPGQEKLCSRSGRWQLNMLVSGSDLSFVAAAVQTWSLPHLPGKDGLSTSSGTKVSLTSSVALLLAVVAANAGHGLILSGSLAGKAVLAWLCAELAYFVYGKARWACNAAATQCRLLRLLASHLCAVPPADVHHVCTNLQLSEISAPHSKEGQLPSQSTKIA